MPAMKFISVGQRQNLSNLAARAPALGGSRQVILYSHFATPFAAHDWPVKTVGQTAAEK
jgi:hypothetical protein